jgi:hypothetical protein
LHPEIVRRYPGNWNVLLTGEGERAVLVRTGLSIVPLPEVVREKRISLRMPDYTGSHQIISPDYGTDGRGSQYSYRQTSAGTDFNIP